MRTLRQLPTGEELMVLTVGFEPDVTTAGPLTLSQSGRPLT
ncbi:hypothetical protein WI560_07780 [Bradyrhizobium sp. A11]